MHRLTATLVAIAAGVTLAAQQRPVFKSAIDLVTLDVTVLDSNRRPVRGLAPSDFTVLEDGSRQQIAVFNAVEIPDVEPPKTSWLREVAPDVRTNDDSKERRLFLIIIDDAAVGFDVYAMKNVKEIARRVVQGFGASDLAAVVYTANNRNSQDFTSDRNLLLQAVDRYPMTGPINEFLSGRYSTGVVMNAIKVLGSLTDRRKAIIYVGAGLPVDLAQAAAAASAGISTMDANGDPTFSPRGSAVVQQGEMGQLAHTMSVAFRDASRSNISVYTLDVCGLRVEGGSGACQPGLEVDYLRNLASATGGRAVVDTNDFTSGVAAIFAENSSYYLLGYQSSNPKQDGKFRRLEVRIDRPGLTILTRSGYVQETLEDSVKRKARLADQPLGAAMAGILPKGDLPMRLSAVPFAIPGKKESSVLVMLGVTQPIRETGARTVEKVDLTVRAYTTDGKQVGMTNLRADVAVRAGATGLGEYEVLAELRLKPGRYQLRAAANVGSLATSGSLYYDVDVPDFSDEPFSLSGLVLTATPAVASGGLKPLLPITPTTVRRFGVTMQAAAFFRVYRGTRRPPPEIPLRIRLRDAEDVLVLDRREVISGAAFATERFANVNLPLPIARLPGGEYLLTVETTTGKNDITRSLRFEVNR